MKLVTYLNVHRDTVKDAQCKAATAYIIGLSQQYPISNIVREMVLFAHANRDGFEKFSGIKPRNHEQK